MVYLLFLSILLLFIGSVILSKKKYINPMVLMNGGFLFSSLMAIYMSIRLDYDISFKTYGTIILFLLIFSLVSFLVFRKVEHSENTKNKVFNIKEFVYILMAIFQVSITLIAIIYIFMNANIALNLKNIPKIISEYRENYSYGTYTLPFYIKYGITLLRYVAFINAFLLSYNIAKNFKFKYLVYFATNICPYFLVLLLQGDRFNILITLIFILIVFIYSRWELNNYFVNKKDLYIMIPAIAMLFVFFVGSKFLLNRSQAVSLLDYIPQYFGGPILLLDKYLVDFNPTEGVLGHETFYSILQFLDKINLISFNQTRHLEFREINGVIVGNVYTGIRVMINDFGYFGMILLTGIFSFLVTYFYKKMIESKDRDKNNYWLFIYAYCAYSIILHFFACCFYQDLSISVLLLLCFNIIGIEILCKLFQNKQIDS